MRFLVFAAISFLVSLCGLRQAYGQAAAAAPNSLVTLDQAIRLAEANEPTYAASVAAKESAHLDSLNARATLLPRVDFHAEGIYTQPSHSTTPGTLANYFPRFIANNDVREYLSQGTVNETLSLSQIGNVRKANAMALQAAAEQEIARRGLVAAVTSLYFGAVSAENRVSIADQAHDEALDFLGVTQKREQAREAAHADVVKAQLQEQQSQRALDDAQLAREKARLELGILLYPDPRTPYQLSNDSNVPILATRKEVELAAAKNNPQMKSAMAALDQSSAGVLAARGAYLPTIGFNYTYGIDAPQLAVYGPNNVRNAGYSAGVTVDLPVWDWLTTQHKVKQSQIQRHVARVTLSSTQRQLIANLDEAYSEAVTARKQLDSLDTSVVAAEDSLRLTRLRYNGGEATVLEVVDAQTTLVATENAREDGRVRYRMALANLQTLTGTM
ncbi:MAG: TolC family protein [Acidobacteriota bacterium]|nr:TolC family protein [Acidobacteriota bacterium]